MFQRFFLWTVSMPKKKGFRTEKKIDNLADWHQTAEAVGHTVPGVLASGEKHATHMQIVCVV